MYGELVPPLDEFSSLLFFKNIVTSFLFQGLILDPFCQFPKSLWFVICIPLAARICPVRTLICGEPIPGQCLIPWQVSPDSREPGGSLGQRQEE